MNFTCYRLDAHPDVTVYRVEGVGTFTLGPNPDPAVAGPCPHCPDGHGLSLAYGLAWPPRRSTPALLPEAPVVAGFTLRGFTAYRAPRALAWARGDRTYEWLWVFTGRKPLDPLADLAPVAVRDAVRDLVATLTEHYLREVAPERPAADVHDAGRDDDPMRRACPGCGAEPGEPCRPSCLPDPEADRPTW